jgi:hypothetical protein
MSTPVFDCDHCERFSKVTLQGRAMKKRGIVRSGVCRRIIKGREIVFKPTPNPPARIVERLIEVGDQFGLDCSQAGAILSPDP